MFEVEKILKKKKKNWGGIIYKQPILSENFGFFPEFLLSRAYLHTNQLR